MLSNLLTVLTDATNEVVASGITDKGYAALAAAIAVLGGMACAIGEGLTAIKAVEGVARNPEAQPQVQKTMMFGMALTETTGIYSLIVALLILFFVAM